MKASAHINWVSDSLFSKVHQTEPACLSSIQAFCRGYYSPLNSIFLCQGYSTETLNQKPFWMLRDGLLPLLETLECMDPSKLSSILLVEKELLDFIPGNWEQRIQAYQIQSQNSFGKNSKPRALLLAGSALLTNEDLLTEWNLLGSALGSKTLQSLPIFAYFPDSISSTIHLLEKLSGKPPTLLNHRQLDDFHEMQGILYHEIPMNILCSDTYPKHLTLSRGAGLVQKNPETQASKAISLSLYHSIRIRPAAVKLGD